MIKVSIVVPVYKCAKYLRRCLDSILNQTFKDFEIILVSDGPKEDNQICEEYAKKDNRITLIKDVKLGLGGARNAGINLAKGEYISFIDSDDWIDNDFIEKLYNAAIENNADIAVAGIIRLHNFHKKYHLKMEEQIITEDTNEKFQLCDMSEKWYVWNKIYKKESLIKNNIKFIENISHEDCPFTIQVLHKMNRMVTVPNTYYFYWRHPNSLVKATSSKAQKDAGFVNEWIDSYVKTHKLSICKITSKRYKFLGLTIYKTKTKNGKTEHRLFNIIKW